MDRTIHVEWSDLLQPLLQTQLWTYKLHHAADGWRTQNMYKVLYNGRSGYRRVSSETYKDEVEQTKHTQDRANQLRRRGHPHHQDIHKKKKMNQDQTNHFLEKRLFDVIDFLVPKFRVELWRRWWLMLLP